MRVTIIITDNLVTVGRSDKDTICVKTDQPLAYAKRILAEIEKEQDKEDG